MRQQQQCPSCRWYWQAGGGDALPAVWLQSSVPGSTRHHHRPRQRRRRSRCVPGSHSVSRWIVRTTAVALVMVSLAYTVGADRRVAVQAATGGDSEGTDNFPQNEYESEFDEDYNDNGTSTERKPYRSGGKIKLMPNRNMLVVMTPDEWDRYQRRKNEELDNHDFDRRRSHESSLASPTQPGGVDRDPTPNLWTSLAPFVERGLLLVALTALAIVDRTPPTTVAAAAALSSSTPAAGSITAISQSRRWLPFRRFRLDWAKLRNLPGEILPSLSAALMIAWVPSLMMQRAWFELGFLVFSLTSEANLRNYLWNEVLPAMGGTARKLFWSEFWKQAWDYLLEPFSHNLLVPPFSSTTTLLSSTEHHQWTQWQSEVARFWSDRVVKRIDKWTASSVKSLLQKNVQASVNGLAEDSWKAVAYAWYPDGRSPSRAQLPSSIEDTARMIEIETDCEDGVCEDDSAAKATSGTVNDEAEEPTPDSSESSVSDSDDEESSDSSSSLASDCDESKTEEPQPVPA